MGNCYMQMDDVGKAIATYEQVVRDDDDCAIGHYNLGSALHARRDLEAAAGHFARTIALEPTYADAHFNLGIVHQELGQLAEALKCYDAAAKLGSHRNLGDTTGPFDLVALPDLVSFSEQRGTDVVFVEVQNHAVDIVREFQQLTHRCSLQPVDTGNTVTG